MRGRLPAVFIDRDGVVNELVPDPSTGLPESPLHVSDVALVPGASAALKRLADAGWALVGVSNQPAAAKGIVSVEALEAIQARVLELLAKDGARFNAFELCMHHPDGVVPGLARDCDCRKPRPGMLLAAAERLGVDLARSWMVGDTDSDVRAGEAAGCATILVRHRPSAHKREGDVDAQRTADDLAGAVDMILCSAE